MPYVRGESLRARLTAGAVPQAEAVAVLRAVAEALEYAHAQGVVHRDIKPENVLLSGRTAVVTDFGIAKALQASRTQAPGGPADVAGGLTQLGTSLGTPAYMAPEQAAADPATDHRADLYAWGVVAYELLAGRHPFAGRTSPQQLMAAHFGEVPAPLPRRRSLPASRRSWRAASRRTRLTARSAAAVLEALDGRPRARTRVAPAECPVDPPRTLSWRRGRGARPRGGCRRVARGGPAGGAPAPQGTAPKWPPLVRAAGSRWPRAPAACRPTPLRRRPGDAITGKLARLAGLRVIDRASVRSVEDAARARSRRPTLGADYVLRATLRWARGPTGSPGCR
jgi:serine/threonine-protein kinase